MFAGGVRLRVADVPLERDEGEYAYAGSLILEGIPPYQLAYNMKFPGTYYAYAAILAAFGRTPWGIHAGLLLVNALTILLVYAVGRRLLGELAAAAGAWTFALLSIDRWVYGVFAHATHFVILAAMAGLYVLLRALEDGRARSYLGAGTLFGVALVMKQHAVFYLPFGAALAYWAESRRPGRTVRSCLAPVGAFAGGSLLPLTATALVLVAQGVGMRFWFWTFQYAREYVGQVGLSEAAPFFAHGFGNATTASLPFWILAGIGLVVVWLTPREPRVRLVVTCFLGASFLAVCPGFYFREHYFVLVLPAVALLAGVAVSSLRSRGLGVAVLLAAVVYYGVRERDYLFTMGTRELIRRTYGANPFVEAMDIARRIREWSDPGDRIAVLGSEPEIYFYADRKGATGYIYTYPLMEAQPFAARMQAEMIREIEASHPRFLVFVRIDRSWLATPQAGQRIFQWAGAYVERCYDLVGVADIYSEEDSRLVWGEAARSYEARSANLVYTFERKGSAPCSAAP